jgi:hypothetical protein
MGKGKQAVGALSAHDDLKASGRADETVDKSTTVAVFASAAVPKTRCLVWCLRELRGRTNGDARVGVELRGRSLDPQDY